MPRRPSKKPKGSRSKPREFNRKDSKLDRWDKPSDIPLDEEDEFHTSRDQILLEGDELVDDDDEGDEDEVFALKGLPESDESEGEDAEEDEGEGDDETMVDASEPPSKNKKKAKGKKGKPVPSSSSSESESEEEGWGGKKSAYYSSNAAQLESDDEEANELEEQEAKRLQAKIRDAMLDDDFGLADPIEVQADPEEDLLVEPTPVVQPLPQDKQSLLRHLEKNNPEALALARDWDDIARRLVSGQANLEKLQQEDPDALDLGMVHLYQQALLTYATTLAFYLHLRASEKYAQKPELLRDHPITSRLLTLKQSLATFEKFELDMSADSDDDEDDDSTLDDDELMTDARMLWSSGKKGGMELDELASLLKEAQAAIASRASGPDTKDTPSHKSTPASEERPKKKRKTSTDAKPKPAPAVVFDVAEPDLSTLKASKSAPRSEDAPTTDLYGEATALHAVDAADKHARRRSLRFHASKIESTAARRQGARAGAMGGDDDIPYRERKKAKEERLKRELESTRRRGAEGDDLDDSAPEPRAERKKRAREDEDDGSGSDADAGGYYDLVQRHAKEKKALKKAEYDAARAAAKPIIEDTADGPRSLTRAILKNRGLTPHRSKSVRNPRVKKRQRFEKAKKTLASQKATYKGGLAETGRYEGEKSGISRVVKSVRL